MSGIALMIHVGGTRMTVDMDDHFTPLNLQVPWTMSRTCVQCGAITFDYETHLVWHIQRGELTLTSQEEAKPRPCGVCGHVHLVDLTDRCGQVTQMDGDPCPCTQAQR